MKPRTPRREIPGLELAEDAVSLLRAAPLSTLLCHVIGALPFVLGLLYFIADMTLDAYAPQSVVAASFWIAVLFVWMKCWHTVFLLGLLRHLGGRADDRWTAGRVIRLALTQAALQPWALLIRPAALLITLPYAWVKSYFENLLIAGDGHPRRYREMDAQARQQALLWTKQSWEALTALALFGFFVWANLLIAIFALPALQKIFLGWETDFTRSMGSLLNTTTFAVSFGAAYLCLNPLWKAVCALRWFRGESVRSGADLLASLSRLRRLAAVLMLAVFALETAPVRAATPAPTPALVAPAEVDEAITRTLTRREFAWRLPRAAVAEKTGWLATFFDGVSRQISKAWRALLRWFSAFIEKIFRQQLRDSSKAGETTPAGFGSALRIVVIALTVLITGALCYFIWRQLRLEPIAARATAEPTSARPDLTSENVTADQLPEDGWLQLARELRASGQFRLALRALYLSALAHLGARQLITIARHKSNRDYERELQRRARQQPELGRTFSGSRAVFEESWYGRREVTDELLGTFLGEVERMRTC